MRSHRIGFPFAAGALLAGVLLFASAGASAQGTESRTSIARPMINGTFIDAAGGQGAFSGNLVMARFEVHQGFVVVVGTLTGTLAKSTGDILGRVGEEAVVPITIVRATCQVLHLDLGPLDLQLLGVHVHLEKSALGITRQHGRTPAFGNLLCSTGRLVAAKSNAASVATNLNAVLSTIRSAR